ncbi:hypothetical protein H6P81_019771 [Aristolochia fimbriata]|uniref:Uncharacterized protein n=1 Tax=Aristolochia fimbriata TaxID=158543 RepID=A0AAV7DVN5_ARIFI|nr:hypothetical protein H6P81_019771 [Aristolochia fimbriata]
MSLHHVSIEVNYVQKYKRFNYGHRKTKIPSGEKTRAPVSTLQNPSPIRDAEIPPPRLSLPPKTKGIREASSVEEEAHEETEEEAPKDEAEVQVEVLFERGDCVLLVHFST